MLLDALAGVVDREYWAARVSELPRLPPELGECGVRGSRLPPRLSWETEGWDGCIEGVLIGRTNFGSWWPWWGTVGRAKGMLALDLGSWWP